MNLDLAPYLPAMRDTAESLMVDTVTIDRWDDGYTTDGGRRTKTYGAPLYGPTVDTDEGRNGRAQIQQNISVSEEEQGGGRTITTLRRVLKLPVSVTGLRVDDRVRVVASAHDPDMVDRAFRISSLHGKTYATTRRVSIEELTS